MIPCATCDVNDPKLCMSCLAGYLYNSSTNSCMAVTSCTGSCSMCPYGYTLSSNQCMQCMSANCIRCLSSNTSICTSCYPGYYLNTSDSSNATCSPCPTSCSTCSNSITCLTCSQGHTATVQSISSDQVICVQCISPCATCMLNAYTCTSCVEGYVFQGWKCITLFNFGFVVTVDSTLNGFYMNYYGFLTSLANAVQASNTNAVTVNSIASGSLSSTSSTLTHT